MPTNAPVPRTQPSEVQVDAEFETEAQLDSPAAVLAAAQSLAATASAAIEPRLASLRRSYRAAPELFGPDSLALLKAAAERSAQARSAARAVQAGAEGARALTVLNDVFGYPSFYPGQREIIEAVMAGRDCLGVMPTGAGKSVTYQIPARLLGRDAGGFAPDLVDERSGRCHERGRHPRYFSEFVFGDAGARAACGAAAQW